MDQKWLIAGVVALVLLVAAWQMGYLDTQPDASAPAPAPAPAPAGSSDPFTEYKGQDFQIPGKDDYVMGFIKNAGSASAARSKCLADPDCLGYNSHGWMKSVREKSAGGKLVPRKDNISFFMKNV